ncbi:cytochrome P450 [Streptomyces hiroshimensis]|uniref:Cytochrome P450 n=1 Tax=Streptomyces hiroshimensis TaxID=66424 RepID=A0ABQ2ZB19_9ACTN|nr:cytochrome P450 [Streptomyces hiroshimensis]GGY07700.1 cytochrome P450 [Streptomyces hiroshimensis]
MKTAASIPLAPGSLPLLGHALPLVRDPLAFVSSLPAHGEMVRLRLGTRSVVMVCDANLTRRTLLEDHVFDKGGPLYERIRELVGDGLVSCPHSRHRRQRRLCQPAFRPDRLPHYAPAFTSSAEAASRSWHDGQVIDVTTEMMALTARIAVETMFTTGLPPEAAQTIIVDINALMETLLWRAIRPSVLERLPGVANHRYDRARARLRHTIDSVTADRRNDPADHGDLLSSLQNAEGTEDAKRTEDPANPAADREGLAGRELTDQILTFFFAGTETTSNTLAWALYLLAAHPEVESRLSSETDRVLAGATATFADLPALEMARHVIMETLRLYPPAWLVTRTVAEDTELGGIRLPTGAAIAFSPYLIHRRPGLYETPDHFDPDRWRRTHPDRAAYLPFGSGARKCIGARFAMAEAVLALVTLTARWRLVRLTDRPVRPFAKSTLSPRGLRMRVTARHA